MRLGDGTRMAGSTAKRCVLVVCKQDPCNEEQRQCSTKETPHHLQVLNALHMGWVEYRAALRTAQRMAGDMEGRSIFVNPKQHKAG